MIVHLVLFKLKPGIEADDPRIAAVQAAMQTLPGQIAVIRQWEHGPNLMPDSQAWDYGLRAGFASTADLQAYFEHPAHQPVLAQWDAIADLAFADFSV
jgi:hypothetical protein